MMNAVMDAQSLAELLLPSTEANWQKAACKDNVRADAWFPFPSREGDEDFDYARGVCAGCPIRRECFDFAARTGQSGVWGGADFDHGQPRDRDR